MKPSDVKVGAVYVSPTSGLCVILKVHSEVSADNVVYAKRLCLEGDHAGRADVVWFPDYVFKDLKLVVEGR